MNRFLSGLTRRDFLNMTAGTSESTIAPLGSSLSLS